MGITVISTSSVSSATAASSAQGTGSLVGAATDFAALLSGQLGNVLNGAISVSNSASSSANLADNTGTVNDNDEEGRSPEDIASDPTLAILMAIPPITPQVQTNTTISVDVTDSASSNVSQSDISSLLAATQGSAGNEKSALATSLMGAGKATQSATARPLATDLSTDTGSGNVAQDKAGLLFGATSSLAEDAPESSRQIDQTANLAGNSALLQATANTNSASNTSHHLRAENNPEIKTPLHSANWASDFSEKVLWLAKNDQQTAQININPPQLGPVQITLQLNGDQASAVFASPHAEVRQAIESSLPQLKEMLASAGINLGQSDVGANLAQQNRNTPFQSPNGNRSADENAILPGNVNLPEGTLSQPIQRGRGMVDLFA
ncbi:MAG: flagellar hook-length control protein FliK [Rhodocyclales bacterium GT-UBC]|nr:MAG: flagellar hook-length control protein FliK [Rhodocyclales bacterium GT-UBC]